MHKPSVFFDTEQAADRITLERLRHHMSLRMGYSVVDTLRVSSWNDEMLHNMVIDFTADLLAQKLADDKYTAHFSYKMPSSWWQHFKQDKMPEWVIYRYPVKYDTKRQTRTVKFTRYATYPMANLAIPKDRRTIDFIGLKEVIKDQVYQEGY